MQNWNDITELTRLHREDLLREASNYRRAQELDRSQRTSSQQRASISLRRVLSPVLALIALLVGTHR